MFKIGDRVRYNVLQAVGHQWFHGTGTGTVVRIDPPGTYEGESRTLYALAADSGPAATLDEGPVPFAASELTAL